VKTESGPHKANRKAAIERTPILKRKHRVFDGRDKQPAVAASSVRQPRSPNRRKVPPAGKPVGKSKKKLQPKEGREQEGGTRPGPTNAPLHPCGGPEKIGKALISSEATHDKKHTTSIRTRNSCGNLAREKKKIGPEPKIKPSANTAKPK